MRNKYEVRGDVTAIFINCKGNSYETLISTVDLPKAQGFPNAWYGMELHKGSIYVYGNSKKLDVKGTALRLHRLITDCEEGLYVDHMNHDTLDNRRENLRNVTPLGNAQNKSGANSHNKSSGVRGVTWHKHHEKWQSSIRMKGKTIHIGYFDSLAEADRAVQNARARFMTHSLESVSSSPSDGVIKYYDKPKRKSISGVRNVHWQKDCNMWRVIFRSKGARVFDKLLHDLEEAKELARKVRMKIENDLIQ